MNVGYFVSITRKIINKFQRRAQVQFTELSFMARVGGLRERTEWGDVR